MSRDPSLRVEPSSETPSPQDAQVVGGYTPTPWYFSGCVEDELGFPCVTDKDGCVICSVVDDGIDEAEMLANAAFIVKAVNSHEANEAKIAAAVKALDRLMRIIDSGIFRDGTHLSIEAHPAVDAARTTLSSLKEGK